MLWFDEDLLRNDELLAEGSTTIFNLNQIVSGVKRDGVIHFSYSFFRREFEMPLQYVVDRFRSFGCSKFGSLADQIQKLVDAEPIVEYNRNKVFPETHDIVKELKGSSYMLYGGEYGYDGARLTELVVSEEFCRNVGIDEEWFMATTIKYGKMPLG